MLYTLAGAVHRGRLFALALAAILLPLGLSGQLPSSGMLEVTVTDPAGATLKGVLVSLERGGVAVRSLSTDNAGVAAFGGLPPAEYSVLVEQFEYQPVRYTGVVVEAGGRSRFTARISRVNGQVLRVEEARAALSITGGGVAQATPAWRVGLPLPGEELLGATRDDGRALSFPGRHGFLGSAGLPPSFTRLELGGLSQSLLRHPGVPAEPLGAASLSRNGVAAVFFGDGGRVPNTAGASSLIQATALAGGQSSLRTWLNLGPGGLGNSGEANPDKLIRPSLQGGFTAGGSLMADTINWAMGAEVFRLQAPGAAPFRVGSEADRTALETDIAAAATGLSDNLTPYLTQPVRSTTGGRGFGNLGVRVGSLGAAGLSFSAASWREKNPLLALEAVNGAGVELSATDLAGALHLRIERGSWLSSTALGLRNATREWSTEKTPYLGLVSQNIAFGAPLTTPADFNEKVLEFQESVTWTSGSHQLTGGFSLSRSNTRWEWLPGASGQLFFGSLTHLQRREGSSLLVSTNSAAPDVVTRNSVLFLQDTWKAAPTLGLTFGVRHDRVSLPDSLTGRNDMLERTTGAYNNLMPLNNRKRLAPSLSLQWDVAGDGRTLVDAGAGISFLPFDSYFLAEVARRSGGVETRRSTGMLVWPDKSSNAPGSFTGYVPGVQRPERRGGAVSLKQSLGRSTTLTLQGSYAHTDYLNRRIDWNRHQLQPSTGSDGRPIWGDLRQYGALIVPAAKSNFRYADYDAIYFLTGDGYVDHYDATIQLAREVGRAKFSLAYTWGQTQDNLVGRLAVDPADQLNPFPEGIGGPGGADWTVGRSDLDVPHRVVADLRLGEGTPLSLGARYRYQSGLPFTPGAPRGVDLNGDGSGGNDPAPLGLVNSLQAAHSCLAGEGFASRNSCRDPGQHALDLGLVWRPGKAGLALTLDIFNLVSSPTGLRDHAAVAVDPAGTISSTGGRVVLPLVANPRFGELLSRRDEPRFLRFGVSLEK